MNAGDTIFVIGTGGAITKVDVPVDSHARERFDDDLERGALRVVADEDVVEQQHPRWPDATQYVLRKGAAPKPATAFTKTPDDTAASTEGEGNVEGESEGEGEGGEPTVIGPPAKSAGKPEWVAFAVAQGMDPDAAAAATKKDLVAEYGD